MTTKKIILIVLTVVSLIPVILSLIGSINQPQVQSNLQLYQTNLVLQASEFSGENIREFEEIRDSVLGKNPYKAAFDQYKEARKLSQKNLAQLKNELQRTNEQSKIIKESESPINSLPLFSGSAEQEKLQQEINQQREEIDKLDIKMGLLEIAQGKEKQALEQWENVKLLSSLPSLKYTADVLSNLWSDQVLVLPNSELTIQEHLNSWFRYYSLNRLYEVENRKDDLIILQEKQQELAKQGIIKLTFVAIIPVLGGLIGVGIIIFSLIQLFLKKESGILAIDKRFKWETPWTIEIPWQVFIVGFFFFGQIVLPILFTFLSVDLTQLSLRGKAVYVLSSYVTMSPRRNWGALFIHQTIFSLYLKIGLNLSG
jgi:hypothetical protein